jgi:hypothetical protein
LGAAVYSPFLTQHLLCVSYINQGVVWGNVQPDTNATRQENRMQLVNFRTKTPFLTEEGGRGFAFCDVAENHVSPFLACESETASKSPECISKEKGPCPPPNN